jgi:hypothetical protein
MLTHQDHVATLQDMTERWADDGYAYDPDVRAYFSQYAGFTLNPGMHYGSTTSAQIIRSAQDALEEEARYVADQLLDVGLDEQASKYVNSFMDANISQEVRYQYKSPDGTSTRTVTEKKNVVSSSLK